MSEFYASRRTVIADVCGLAGMAVAGFAASTFVWEALASGFRSGRLERAFFIFLAVVLGASAIGGAAGLAGGRAVGAAWERRHRRRRLRGTTTPAAEEGSPVGSALAGSARTAPGNLPVPQHPVRPTRPSSQQPGTSLLPASLPPGLELRPFGAAVDQYLVLRRRAAPDGAPLPEAAASLRRSSNLGAWDGERLVGAVRIVGDGHSALVTELLVDPDFRRRGIARALLGAALASVPGGQLYVPAPDDEAAAFLHAAGGIAAGGVYSIRGAS